MNKLDNKNLKVAIVVADKDEYIHIENMFSDCLIADNIGSLLGHKFNLKGNNRNINVKTICSGIGKVDAAAATALLGPDYDLIVNIGLSGGFEGSKKHDIIIGDKFYEHDFDLTGIGYALGQKPGQPLCINADEKYLNDIITKYPFVKKGAFVTGDSFVCSKEQHDLLKEKFAPIACDMESAAVGYAASLLNIPFISLRMVSDGADDSSADNYTETLYGANADSYVKLLFDWLKTL